jgi:hypothetical protein
MKLTGENRSTLGKACPSATLSTTNPTWTDPGSKPGLRGERPATNRLSHGTAGLRVKKALLKKIKLDNPWTHVTVTDHDIKCEVSHTGRDVL